MLNTLRIQMSSCNRLYPGLIKIASVFPEGNEFLREKALHFLQISAKSPVLGLQSLYIIHRIKIYVYSQWTLTRKNQICVTFSQDLTQRRVTFLFKNVKNAEKCLHSASLPVWLKKKRTNGRLPRSKNHGERTREREPPSGAYTVHPKNTFP